MRIRSARRLYCTLLGAWFTLGLAGTAHAAGAGMPWEQPLQQIIITTGLTLAFGDTAGGFRRLIQIVFGISIAFAASSFFLTFFSFGGGAFVS